MRYLPMIFYHIPEFLSPLEVSRRLGHRVIVVIAKECDDGELRGEVYLRLYRQCLNLHLLGREAGIGGMRALG